MDFAGRLASMLKEKGIHVLLETCGLFPFRAFMDRLFSSLDTIYYDIKIMDPEAHRRECGADNKRILENFSLLVPKCRAAGKELLARVPLVPGITDREENLEAVAGFLGEQGVDRVALMEYNPLWGIKCEKIGAENRLADRPESREWMEREKVKACQELFQSKGIEVV
jgi:pyruvate formate lyase activating enzyme